MKKFLVLFVLLSVLLGLVACDLPFVDSGTPLPTEPSTEAPTEPPVKTVLEYTQQTVIPTWCYDDQVIPHYITCPALTADTTDARAINKEINDLATDLLETIKSAKDGENTIYQFDYDYTNYKGIVALYVEGRITGYATEWWSSFRVYYFDTNCGRQMSYEQYLEALGITKEQIDQLYADEVTTVHWIAADTSRTFVQVTDDWGDLLRTEDPILN